MTCGYRLVLLTVAALTNASVLASVGISGSVAENITRPAQYRSDTAPYIVLAQAPSDPKNQPKKPPPPAPAPPARVIAPTAAPRVVAPVVAPKVIAPAAAPKFVAPPGGPKVVGPANNPNLIAPGNNRNFVAPRSSGQRVIGPGGTGPSGNAARALAIRGANNTAIDGRNFSVRRGSYRAYRGGYWRTFVGVGTLGAILYGGYRYFPYAYIDAPPEFCDGETEDGCQLQWQEVQTLEGPLDFQCVAYCPWQ